jgi:site-specific recombinase XerD
LEADPALWDTRAGRISGKSNHAREVNGEIDKINVAINAKYREIVSIHGKATAAEVKNAFQGTACSQETLLKVLQEHNKAIEEKVGVNRAKSTFTNYQASLMTLEQFIKHKYRVSDMSFRQLDYSFIENYDFYLKIDCGYAPNTVVLKMEYLQRIIKFAIRKRIITHNPFAGFCVKRPKPTQRFVPIKELKKLMKTPLNSNALEVTLDIFVFSCYTGLSYIDLYHLTHKQIEKDDDGFLWVKTSRQKTDNEFNVLLLNEALCLIEKYRGTASSDKVFPMKSNPHMNKQLKTIAALCGIKRRLTFHMSRHTFATVTCLSQGISIETAGKQMGHNDLKSTERYAIVTPDRINVVMKALSKSLKGVYTLAS